MPTRRIMLLTVGVVTLMFPARQVVRGWARRQLIARDPDSLLRKAGEVVVTIL